MAATFFKTDITLDDLMALADHAKRNSIEPDEGGNYTLYIQPTMADYMRRMAARWKHYHDRHVVRWERRYGKPYPQITSVVGSWGGIRFMT